MLEVSRDDIDKVQRTQCEPDFMIFHVESSSVIAAIGFRHVLNIS